MTRPAVDAAIQTMPSDPDYVDGVITGFTEMKIAMLAVLNNNFSYWTDIGSLLAVGAATAACRAITSSGSAEEEAVNETHWTPRRQLVSHVRLGAGTRPSCTKSGAVASAAHQGGFVQ